MSYTNSYLRSDRRSEGFSLSYIMGDPFALSTISISIIGWVISFAGSIAVDVEGKFPTLTWWGIVFQLFVIVSVIFIIGYDQLYPYQLALIGFLAIATVYSTNSTNNFVWNNTPASGAVAAGQILLSIINLLWLFYFGTSSDEPVHAFVDSFSVNGGVSGGVSTTYSRGGAASGRGSVLPPNGRQSVNPFGRYDSMDMLYSNKNSTTTGSNAPGAPGAAAVGGAGLPINAPPSSTGNSGSYPQMFTSAQLGAFENSEQNNYNRNGRSYGSRSSMGDPDRYSVAQTSELNSPVVYPYKAKAIYKYEANPQDSNELSFDKGEILEISSIAGRWWQARRANGQVGICPSNYVLLQENTE